MNDITVKESFIKDELAKYNVTDSAIAEMEKSFLPLKVKDKNDKEGREIVRTARLAMVKKRVEVEQIRKSLKAESLNYGRAVDAEAKRITALLLPIENHLTEQEEIVSAEEKRIEQEKADAEKNRVQSLVNELLKYGCAAMFEYVKEMTPEEYAAKLESAKAEFIRKEKEKQDEIDRMAKVKAEQEAEALRLDAIRKEQEEKQKTIDIENQKIADEKKAIEDQKKKEEQEKIRLAELENAKKEAAENAIREAKEKDRLAKEQEEKRLIEAARIESLKPDKEKLLLFAQSLNFLNYPALTNQTALAILEDVKKQIHSISNKILRQIETL